MKCSFIKSSTRRNSKWSQQKIKSNEFKCRFQIQIRKREYLSTSSSNCRIPFLLSKAFILTIFCSSVFRYRNEWVKVRSIQMTYPQWWRKEGRKIGCIISLFIQAKATGYCYYWNLVGGLLVILDRSNDRDFGTRRRAFRVRSQR